MALQIFIKVAECKNELYKFLCTFQAHLSQPNSSPSSKINWRKSINCSLIFQNPQENSSVSSILLISPNHLPNINTQSINFSKSTALNFIFSNFSQYLQFNNLFYFPQNFICLIILFPPFLFLISFSYFLLITVIFLF